MLHHGRQDDRDLLPPELSGDDPEAPQRRVLRHCRGRPTAWLPGVQAVPPRCLARLAGVERARRCRRQGDALDRRWSHRQGRGRRSRRSAELQRAPDQPAVDHRARCRSVGARPGPTGPDGADADRDHRDADHPDRLCRRVRQCPPVQRHDSRGVRVVAHRAEGCPQADRCRRHSRAPAAVPSPVPRRIDLRLSRRSCRTGRRELGWHHVSTIAQVEPRERCHRCVTRCDRRVVQAVPRQRRRCAGRGAALPSNARPRRRSRHDRGALRR